MNGFKDTAIYVLVTAVCASIILYGVLRKDEMSLKEIRKFLILFGILGLGWGVLGMLLLHIGHNHVFEPPTIAVLQTVKTVVGGAALGVWLTILLTRHRQLKPFMKNEERHDLVNEEAPIRKNEIL